MRSERDRYIKETGKGLDIERNVSMPNSWVALLAPGQDEPFRLLHFYTKGFLPRNTYSRTGFCVEIATTDDLKMIISECTHFAIGDKSSVGGNCYLVSDGDFFQPTLERFSWRIFGSSVPDIYVPTI